MITTTAYRAAIGSFYGTMKKCANKCKTEPMANDHCFNDCFFDTYGSYISLCIVRTYFPTLLKVFEIIGVNEISNPSDFVNLLLLLGGDIEVDPGPIQEYNQTKPAKLANNATNTCFANSSLQLLNSIPEFKTIVMKQTYPTAANFRLDTSLKSIITAMNNPSQLSNDLNCHREIRYIMSEIPGMRFRAQQDAHEFLLYILDKTTNSRIKALFQTCINEKVVCSSQQCQNKLVNDKTERHSILSVSLNLDDMLLNTISDLIHSEYLTPDSLPDYKCESDTGEGCTQRGSCNKKQMFESLPNNVLIQLKIFDHDNEQRILRKRTNIPIQLDRVIHINNETLHLCGVI